MSEMVGAMLIREGRILLGLRSQHKSYAGCWDIFGGRVESGESVLQALRRELTEELNIIITYGKYIKQFDLQESSDKASLLHIYRVDAWEGEPTIANDEHVDLRWFTPSEAQALRNLPVSEYKSLFAMFIQ